MKTKDFERAIRRYETAKAHLTSDYDFTDEQKEKAKALNISIWTNIAMCQDKLGQESAVLDSCSEALKLDEHSVKALYRRGCIESKRGNDENASKDLNAALAREPGNVAVKKALAALKKRRAVQDAKDRKSLGGMFDKFAAKDAKKERQRKVVPNTIRSALRTVRAAPGPLSAIRVF